ncbi:MAG: CoA transferase [Actinomycetota bacterium]|nr:CoA transferase [Actinomycetota bacterium]
MHAERVVRHLDSARLDFLDLDPERIEVTGDDPYLESAFPLGELAASALVAVGHAAAELAALRDGPPRQVVRSDVRTAAASLVGYRVQRIDGRPLAVQASSRPTVAFHRGADDRWIHLHGGFPELHDGTLRILGIDKGTHVTYDRVSAAVGAWKAFDLEDALADAGLCGAVARTPAEWAAHPQGRAVGALAAVEISKLDDSPPEPLPIGCTQPLDGVRVLDLTRVLAGPTCGRTLAQHGADVLRVGASQLPTLDRFVIDTGHGKRSTNLDLARADDAARLRELVRTADVVTQGYRPGALERRGFGADHLVSMRPGIVHVDVSCYGAVGPWRDRPGWEQLAQSATGLAVTQGSEAEPALLPAAATDYMTGYLGALGALEALRRRATEGGSWLVEVSLCQTARWLTAVGPSLDAADAKGLGSLDDLMTTVDTAWGLLDHLPPAVTLDRMPTRWTRPPSPLGTNRPHWH